MTTKRLTSIDPAKARGLRMPALVRDELDAVTTNAVQNPTSDTRAALDGRYRASMTDTGGGVLRVQFGTVVTDPGGGDPISVADESVAELIISEDTATRAVLDSLYKNDLVLADEDIAALILNPTSDTYEAIAEMIAELAPGGGMAGDADVRNLIISESLTRAALDARYGVAAELSSGAVPAGFAHEDAGTGALISYGGTRLAFRATVTTGANPVPGGVLAAFTLVGYTLAPTVQVNPRDPVTAAANPYGITSTSVLHIQSRAELQAWTAYTFDVNVIGV